VGSSFEGSATMTTPPLVVSQSVGLIQSGLNRNFRFSIGVNDSLRTHERITRQKRMLLSVGRRRLFVGEGKLDEEL